MSRPSCTRFVKFIRKGVADCHSITAVSTSDYSDSDGNHQYNANAVVKFDDTVILDGANRGITMYVLNASTGGILYNYNFDTYGDSDTNSAGLVTALGSYKEAVNAVLVLVSQDAIALTEEVIEALQSYGGGAMDAAATPARTAFAFIGQGGVPSGRAYYEVRAYEKATVSLQASVTNGALIQRGADGADAVTVIGSGEDIVFTKVGQIAKVYVDAYKGQKQIAYQDDFYCSAFSSSLFDGAVGWGFSTDGDRFFYYFELRKQTDLNEELTYTATVNSVEYKRVIRISTAFDGERGPALRGPQAWSDCAVGYVFYAGGDGEEWKDVVLYDGNYYSCVTGHAKTADNYPTSSKDTANGYWKLADTFELVATKILLSQYALVKNLGVETIDMKDSDGNVLFQAKDGNVICKTGTFENVTISGVLNGVTGSFKSLNCVNNSGTVVANISFGSDGRMWFNNGDLYHQGTKDGRSLRFYMSNVWCRGVFGARERCTLLVYGTYGYYYTNGVSNTGTRVSFTSATDNNGHTYYTLVCYGSTGDYSGFPVDTIVFKITSSTTYNYNLSMASSQRILLVNANDDHDNVQVYSQGYLATINGGAVRECVKIYPSFFTPTLAETTLGRGLLLGAQNDNDW